jgi:hypothetical protein
MRRQNFRIGIVFVLLTSAISFAAGPFFVSLQGNDSTGIGSIGSPWKTIEHARDTIAKITKNGSKMTDDITIFLRAGTYWIQKTITFDEKSSGGNGRFIIYKAYPGDSVFLNGGILVTGWTPYKNGIYKAKVTLDTVDQVYIDGQRAVKARLPNMTNPNTFSPYLKPVSWDTEKKHVAVRTTDLPRVKNLSGDFILVTEWVLNRFQIRDVVKGPNGTTMLSFKSPAIDNAFQDGGPANYLYVDQFKLQKFYLENSETYLDTENEWFFKKGKDVNYLLYKPFRNQQISKLSVIVPEVTTLLSFTHATNVSFEGFTIQYSAWNYADDERVTFQGSYARSAHNSILLQRGGIEIDHSSNIRICENTIRNMGGSAIRETEGCWHNSFKGNKISDIGGSGITITGYEDRGNKNPSRHAKNDTIINNIISKVGQDHTASDAIFAVWPDGMICENNEIFNTPETGISVGWEWDTTYDYAFKNNTIRHNNVHSVMQVHFDGAGIYAKGKQPGTVIDSNWVHDIHEELNGENGLVAGIYLDDCSKQIVVKDNVIERVDKPIHKNRLGEADNIFANNEAVDSAVIKSCGPKGN